MINNSDLIKEIREGGKIQQLVNNIPNQLADKVVPVMEVNPKFFRIVDYLQARSDSSTGSKTILTLPSDRDVYITGYTASMVKDATCDAADGSSCNITGTINGQSVTIAIFPILTTTEQNLVYHRDFVEPIKFDRGTTIQWSATFTAGKMVRVSTWTGFQVLNINA